MLTIFKEYLLKMLNKIEVIKTSILKSSIYFQLFLEIFYKNCQVRYNYYLYRCKSHFIFGYRGLYYLNFIQLFQEVFYKNCQDKFNYYLYNKSHFIIIILTDIKKNKMCTGQLINRLKKLLNKIPNYFNKNLEFIIF